jgi:hypothetical protein
MKNNSGESARLYAVLRGLFAATFVIAYDGGNLEIFFDSKIF